MGDLFTFWILRIFLLLVFVVCGFGISYDKKSRFCVYSLVSGLCYSLIQGLRYARGVDYMHYKFDMEGHWFVDNYEVGYRFIVIFLSQWLHLPYWGCFICYSALLIFAVLLVLKRIPQMAVWGLPMFFLITGTASENLIRQYLAISFIIYAYYFFLCKKNICMWFMLVFSFFIHVSAIYPVILFVFFAYVKFKTKIQKPWIYMGVYSLLFLFWNVSYLSIVPHLLDYVPFFDSSNMQGYIEYSDYWFTSESSLSETLGKNLDLSFAHNSLLFLVNNLVIFYGYKVKQKDNQFRIPYYYFLFSLFFAVIGKDLELYYRCTQWTYFMTAFVVSSILSTSSIMANRTKSIICFLFFVLYYYGIFISQIGVSPESGCAFVWNV